jgi:hypothetical protein
LVRTGRKLPLLQKQHKQFSTLVDGELDFQEMSNLTKELEKLLGLVQQTRPSTTLLTNLSRAGALDSQKNERSDYIRSIVQKQVHLFKKAQGKSINEQPEVNAVHWVKHIEPSILHELKQLGMMDE